MICEPRAINLRVRSFCSLNILLSRKILQPLQNRIQDPLGTGVPIPFLAGDERLGAQVFVSLWLREEPIKTIREPLEIARLRLQKSFRVVSAQPRQIKRNPRQP